MNQTLSIRGYRIIKEVLPPGGWANVYLAEYKNRKVAIKVLKPKFARQIKYVKEFFQEANLLAKIHSPNIVRIVDIGSQSHPPFYYTMVYYSRGNLENFIKEKKILSTEVIVKIVVQICNALETINQNGHLHLDLKPSNILFGDNNRVVLTDFGASQRLVFNDKNEERKGTPQYMSPEQFDVEKQLSFASDLYSLGIIMYYMACGHLPFNGNDINKLHILHTVAEPFPLKHYNKKVNRKLVKIILKLLAKKPEDRYVNARLLAEDLQKLVSSSKGKQYKLKVERLKANGKYALEYMFTKFPVIISNRADVFTSIEINKRSNKNIYISIGISPNGKMLVKDKSDIGIKVAESIIQNQSKLIHEKSTRLIVQKNKFKISVVEDKSSFIYKSSIYAFSFILLLGILMAFLYLSNRSDLSKPEISNLNINKKQIWYDEPFQFSFNSILDSSSTISAIIISPFGDEAEIVYPPDKDEFIYTRGMIKERESPFNFSLRIMDNNGLYSNWLSNKLAINNYSSKIRLTNLAGIPDRVKVGEKIRYSFEIVSILPKDQTYIQIKKIFNKREILTDHLILLDELIKEIVFNKTGQVKLEIRAISKDGKVRSNVISKKIFVTMDLPNPKVTISYANIRNNKWRFSCDFSDDFFEDESLHVDLLVNDIRTDFKVEKGLNVYSLQEKGNYKFLLRIESPDGRVGYSNIIEQSN